MLEPQKRQTPGGAQHEEAMWSSRLSLTVLSKRLGTSRHPQWPFARPNRRQPAAERYAGADPARWVRCSRRPSPAHLRRSHSLSTLPQTTQCWPSFRGRQDRSTSRPAAGLTRRHRHARVGGRARGSTRRIRRDGGLAGAWAAAVGARVLATTTVACSTPWPGTRLPLYGLGRWCVSSKAKRGYVSESSRSYASPS